MHALPTFTRNAQTSHTCQHHFRPFYDNAGFGISALLALSLIQLWKSCDAGVSLVDYRDGPRCCYLPGYAGWPDAKAWSALNATVGGRLTATVPLATPCHDPAYNKHECAQLKKQWIHAPAL
jgi:hypothetical protein